MNVRESILLAGVALLKEKGIAALTQPQVARAAGIKQSHLTYYFPRRADLLLGIAERIVATIMEELAGHLGEDPRRSTLAASIGDAMIAGLPPRILIGLIVAADANPRIRAPLGGLITQVRNRLQGLLTQAGVSASAEATLLFHATVVGLALMHQARMTPESAAEVRGGIAALLRLLAPPPRAVETGEP